jgi:hypothetical protein
LVVLFLSFVYLVYEVATIPSGGHPFGHLLGVLGAILMLMTEFVYSARKRWHFFRFGQVRHWLSFHIFTGIVGPALVLMHTGFEFRGLAGFTMLLTVLVVLSGFIGRYIYTSVPRTLAGAEVSRRELEAVLTLRRDEMQRFTEGKSAAIQYLAEQYVPPDAGDEELRVAQMLMRRYDDWKLRRRLRSELRQLESAEQARLKELEQMMDRQQRLIRQINSLQTVRRMMGIWHTFHIPLGITLFTAMTVHIVAALYYGGI